MLPAPVQLDNERAIALDPLLHLPHNHHTHHQHSPSPHQLSPPPQSRTGSPALYPLPPPPHSRRASCRSGMSALSLRLPKQSPSAARATTLTFAVVVTLSAGTNYVFSAYAPQLGERLSITQTETNIIGAFGNAGVYLSGPAWGLVIDGRGPRLPLLVCALLLFTGYWGIHAFYASHLSSANHRVTAVSFFSMLTGMGGSGALAAALNAVAKSFSDKTRASSAGVVLAGFGLSAFLYSFLAHTAFPGSTDDFLLTLALGTSASALLGAALVRVVHPSYASSTPSAAERGSVEERQPLFEEPPAAAPSRSRSEEGESEGEDGEDEDEETKRLRARDRRNSFFDKAAREEGAGEKSGRRLLREADFWLMFVVVSLLSGTGLMWINNVGSVTQALFAFHRPAFDRIAVEKAQARQVSIVSIMNCAGRVLIGMISDQARNRWALERTWFACVVSGLFVLSQLLALAVSLPENLDGASASIGFAYGALFGLFPVLTLEWWGVSGFSLNWGLVSLSPAIAGPTFNLLFGKEYDSHAPSQEELALYSAADALLPRSGAASSATCLEGRECYAATLRLTAAAGVLSLLLSVWVAVRRTRRARAAAVRGLDD